LCYGVKNLATPLSRGYSGYDVTLPYTVL